MFELTQSFIISQIVVAIAMVFDFASLQFRARKNIFLCLAISVSLISLHYFLLGKTAAGWICVVSVARFVISAFSNNKNYIFIFLILNALTLIFTYKEIYDLVFFCGISIFIVGNFQSKDKPMRLLMISGTALVLFYNIIILSPMGIVVEGNFLASNLLGYFRYHIKKQKPPKIITPV